MVESDTSLLTYIRQFFTHIRKRLPLYIVLMLIVFGVFFVFRDTIYDSFIRRNDVTVIYYDETGMAVTDYGWVQGVYVGPQDNPLVIAQAAELYLEEVLDGNATAEPYLLNILDWIIENRNNRSVDPGGGPVDVTHWTYDFSIYDFPSGWYSAMGDAEILHALALAYDYYNDTDYLDICYEIISSFEIDKEIGGTKLVLDGGGSWYPEVIVPDEIDPNFPERRILNGFLFALEDLYYSYEILNESRVLTLFNDGVLSAVNSLHLYEHPENWTYYQLDPLTPASVSYHQIHVDLMQSFYEKTNFTEFKTYHDRWITFTDYPEDSFWELTERRIKEIQYGIMFMLIAAGTILLLDFAQMRIRLKLTKSS